MCYLHSEGISAHNYSNLHRYHKPLLRLTFHFKWCFFYFAPRLWNMLKASPNPNHQVWGIKHQRKLRRHRTVRKKEAYQKFPCWRSCRAGTSERSRLWPLSKSFTLSRQHLVGIRTAMKETRRNETIPSTLSGNPALSPAGRLCLLCAEVTVGPRRTLGRV